MKSWIVAWACIVCGITSAMAQKAYFQQEVKYSIDVRLDDTHDELFASEQIVYLNNSPDSLPFLYFHLWPNGYKNNSTCLAKQLEENGELLFHFADDNDRGYIDGLDFKIDGQPIRWEFVKDTIDIAKLYLASKLAPGAKITISTPFHVKIPLGKFSRLGHLGQQYQITQWYPKPAVYDRNGWNQMPYLNQGEFYSEFGTFDVNITLPKNYVIDATGDLVDNPAEEQFMAQKEEETKVWMEEFKLSGKQNLNFPPSSTETKTLHFHQEKVHDFAWFCDKRYRVLRGDLETPAEHNKVRLVSLFTDAQAQYWIKSIPYIHDAAYFYSLWNGDYPYKHITAVDGGLSAGAGMEYPNITVIGNASSDFELETVIMHEVGHNWFYGMLGSNERKNPWMDEGINSFNENRYIETKYPDAKLTGNFSGNGITRMFDLDRHLHKDQYYLSYIVSAKKDQDQPIQLAASEYTKLNYAGIVYSKTAIVFDYLLAYLGTETMDAAMHAYFRQWQYKHPQPDDLRKILEQVSGKDLSWFFDDMIKTTKKLDYQILASRPHEKGWDVLVRNKGQIKGPVALCGIKDNKLRGIVWYEGFEGTQILGFPPVKDGIDYFMIDYNEDMPEINRKNNILYTKGLFKRIEPLRFQFLTGLDRSDRTQIFWTPVLGWNDYNRFMPGLALYNIGITQKKFEYLFMPMYAVGTKNLSGTGKMGLNLPFENGLIQELDLGISASRYAYNDIPVPLNFNRFVPEIKFNIRPKRARSTLKQSLRLRAVMVLRDDYRGYYSTDPSTLQMTKDTTIIYNATWSLINGRKLNPYSIVADYQTGQKMQKLSLIARYEITFDKGKSIDFRAFGGTFLQSDNNPAYAFRMSGQTGYQDYLYDYVYLGRNETTGLLSRQFTETDGGFKVYSPWGQTTKWLTALNIKSSLPILPSIVRVYADIGTCDKYSLNAGTGVLYDYGFNLSVFKNILEIYFPVGMSNDIHTYLYGYNNYGYGQTIRFTLNLNLINPFDLVKNFSL